MRAQVNTLCMKMEEMAVISQVPWRLPLSPTLRDNDYFEQEQSDLFHNLEKLIASAVSICRLNGSLQCQIGGLITVIEELQRLLRHSFSEIKRLEKTVDHQKHNSTNKISDLHKQVMLLEARVGTSNWTTQLPIPQDDRCITPRSSLNGDKCTFNGEKDASQASEEGHVSLVDESYGYEESDNLDEQVEETENSEAIVNLESANAGASDKDDTDNNLDEHAEETENSEAIVNLESANEGADTDHNLDKQEEETENSEAIFDLESANEGASDKDDTEDSPSPLDSGAEAPAKQMEENSQASVDTHSSDQTVEFSETTSNISEETALVPRILRNSKQTIDSKSSSEGLSSKPRESRSVNLKPTLSKRNHKLTKDLPPPVKKQGRDPKQPRRLHRKKPSEVKGSPKVEAMRENCIPENYRKKLRVQKTTGSEPKPKDASLKEVERESNVATTASKSSPLHENPIGRFMNLDFLLTVNQIMSDLVSDDTQEEAVLDQVTENARKEVVNLAKLYRLRVRIVGKCEDEFPVVLVKCRESCFPKPGEVDGLLSKMSDVLASKKEASLLKKSGIKHSIGVRKRNSSSKSKKRKV